LCAVSDPIWNSLNDLSDMNPHFLKKSNILYKDLENKTVDVGGWGDVDEAYKIIKICSDRFDQRK
jgi:inorganic pyrophosphatase